MIESTPTRYQETTTCTPTTKKLNLNARMSVKPQDDWVGLYFPEEPFDLEKPFIRTNQRLHALEVYQKKKR
jgi:hypothetical protein